MMKLYQLDETVISMLNLLLFAMKEMAIRHTFPLTTRTITIKSRESHKKYGDTLIITIEGATYESEIDVKLECENNGIRFELDEIEVNRAVWYFIGLDGLENVKSIELNETSEVII